MKHSSGGSLILVLALLRTPSLAQQAPGTPATGRLTVTSQPAGATVYLDDTARGVTPVSLEGLPLGEHRLRLVKPGYLENSQVLKLGTGAPRVVTVKLTPQSKEPPGDVAVADAGKEEEKGGAKRIVWIGLGALGAGAATYAVLTRNKAPLPGTINVSPTGSGLQAVTSFTFTSQGASDPNHDSLTFSWSFSDGVSASGPTATHVFATTGSFTVDLSVSDGKTSVKAPAANITVKDLTGVWRGSAAGFPFTFNLTQNGSSVTGTYSDADGPGTVSGDVSSPRAVNLTVNQPPFAPFAFAGSADSEINRISGSIGRLSFTMTR